MIDLLKNFWKKQDSLERKLFWSILVVVSLVATGSSIFTLFEGMGAYASLLGFGCAFLCAVVAVVAVRTSLYNQCYLVMCCVLTWFLMPLLFLFCGGITSGMPLYCITAVALLAFASRGKAKLIAFAISVLIYVSVFVASWAWPTMIVAELDRDGSYLDILVSLVFTSVTLFAVGAISMRSYAVEREKKELLLAKLNYISTHDPLTGLYNRRHLITHLENVVWRRRNDFYLMMMDLDDLKRVNDTLGHLVGDQVICSVAHLLSRFLDETAGECVARYGGETFVYAISANSEVEAFAKADRIRKDVRALTFEDYPQVSVTMSGGFVVCGGHEFFDFKQLLSKADKLLGEAKKCGKNQIRSMVEK